MTKILLFLVGIIPLLLLVPLANAVPNMQITMLDDKFILVSKPLLYVKNGFYFIKVVAKSITHYTIQNAMMSVFFTDPKSGYIVNNANTQNSTSVSPNQTANFDINTTYTKSKGDKEFPFLAARVGS